MKAQFYLILTQLLYDSGVMSFAAKLKVIALGTATTLKRLDVYVSDGEFVLVGFTRMSDVISRLEQEYFDVVLIDSLHDEALNSCRCTVEMNCALVALLVRETEANWQNLGSWEVDGFISDESGKTEMVARITALARRSRKVPVTQQ
jgi:hypothetical protein